MEREEDYRWPDAVRDEVLIRVLELNAERAAEEARAGTRRRTWRPRLGHRVRRSGGRSDAVTSRSRHGAQR